MKKLLNSLRLGTKVVVFVLVLVVLAIIAQVVISQVQINSTIKAQGEKELKIISDFHKSIIDKKFDGIKESSKKLLSDEELITYLKKDGKEVVQLSAADSAMFIEMGLAIEPQTQDLPVPKAFKQYVSQSKDLNVFVLDAKNAVRLQKGDAKSDYFQKSVKLFTDKIEFQTSRLIKETGKSAYIYSMMPIEADGKILGRIIVKTDFIEFLNNLPSKFGVGESAEILYALKDKNDFDYISKARLNNGEVPRRREADLSKHPVALALKGQTGRGEFIDYNAANNIAFWRPLNKFGVAQIAKIKESEVYSGVSSVVLFSIIAAVAVLGLSFFLTIIFSKILIQPLMKLKAALMMVSKGVLPKKIKTDAKDEIGEMTDTINDLVYSLKNTADFAHQIGRGNFEAQFKPLSKKDALGMALVDMKDSLQQADKNDNLRNWVVTGVAEIGEILRNNDSLASLGDEILLYITDRINAIQGAFYTLNEEEEEGPFIEMMASYAYECKKYIKAKYKIAEGLVGQAAAEKDKILRTEIPENYVNVTSGLMGDQKPSCILLIPLITNETVYGVLEFASFHVFNEGEIKFVEEVSEIIARTIFNIKVNERTRRLLEESQRMSSELQVQQKELQQNAIEMEAKQEEITRANKELEVQIEEVNMAQKRIHVLLENASEVITIYERDMSLKYVSPSVEHILGYSAEELVGASDIGNINEENRDNFKEFFAELVANPDVQLTLQYQYTQKDGDTIWLEAKGNNMLEDPAINGIVINSQDITERRRAEEEERKRGQMQALSENSLDLITRIDDEGKFFYINPTIQSLTGEQPHHFINKALEDVGLNESVVEAWKNVLDTVFQTEDKYATEMDFPTEEGNRIMAVNAIPERDQEDNVESVLVVSHDITEQKAIENQIREKNKKINDSINYAERIQDAILPNTEIIKRDLPNSFIYFLPRDVVSGDFPWYLKDGDDIYISAVDCTGHGVPGALISIIGFFLLQDVVVGQGIKEPGKVLDGLDHMVIETLRQNDENSKLKDGMDIGFCRINTKENVVEYAGAHRPLYLVRKGELIEFKGDKFPIGGGNAYTNKTNFKNHRFEIEEGDAIYFFSDGYPDQFGGPDNRKFGPKRIKSMVSELEYETFDEVQKEVADRFQEWKDDFKQTDDVLLIGIKF